MVFVSETHHQIARSDADRHDKQQLFTTFRVQTMSNRLSVMFLCTPEPAPNLAGGSTWRVAREARVQMSSSCAEVL